MLAGRHLALNQVMRLRERSAICGNQPGLGGLDDVAFPDSDVDLSLPHKEEAQLIELGFLGRSQ